MALLVGNGRASIGGVRGHLLLRRPSCGKSPAVQHSNEPPPSAPRVDAPTSAWCARHDALRRGAPLAALSYRHDALRRCRPTRRASAAPPDTARLSGDAGVDADTTLEGELVGHVATGLILK